MDLGFIYDLGPGDLGRVIPKEFENGIHSFPAGAQYKKDVVENKPPSLLVVSLGKTPARAKQST